MDVEEAEVDVSGDPHRAIFREGPFYVPGIRATYFVPFTGDPDLFKCRPSSYTTIIPAVSELRRNELVLAYERADTNVVATKEFFDRELSDIKQYLGWVRADAHQLNDSLPPAALKAVTARQRRLNEVAASTASLGVPIRRAGLPTTAPVARPTPPKPRREPSPEMYDVALSFAGEQRTYVEQVATGLREAGVSVFYDTFERADLWGKNLVDHLAGIFPNAVNISDFLKSETCHYGFRRDSRSLRVRASDSVSRSRFQVCPQSWHSYIRSRREGDDSRRRALTWWHAGQRTHDGDGMTAELA